MSARLAWAGVTLAIICAGLLFRWPALGLPWPVAKYAGSALWGAMVYASLRMIHPRAPILAGLTVAATIALGVEGSRLYHQPDLDAFRATMAGRLLLGSLFSLWNLVAYAAGISVVALAEAGFVRRL